MKRALGFSLAAWVVYRVVLQLFGQFALSRSWMPVYPGFPIEFDALGMWSRFDSSRYLEIITNGYYPGRFGPSGWFPGYPWASKPLTLFFSPLASCLIVSGLCLVAALVVIHELSLLDSEESGAAYRSAMLVLAFPSAFIFSAVYSESLFLLLCAGSMLAVRNEKDRLACLLAALATLTRLPGICLIPALAWEMWARKKRLSADFLWLLLPGVAILGFFLHLQNATGSFFAYFETQNVYGEVLSIWNSLSGGRSLMLEQKTGLAFLLLEIGVIVAFWGKLRPSYRWFVVCWLLMASYHTQGVCSQRFMLAQFPLFLVAGQVLRGRWFTLVLSVCVSLQLWLFTLWVYGYRATY